MAEYITVNVAGVDYYIQLRPVMTVGTYRATPVPCDTPDAVPAQAAINLLPAALTQAEMEALKPGPMPDGGCCQECRLRAPFGFRSQLPPAKAGGLSPVQHQIRLSGTWTATRASGTPIGEPLGRLTRWQSYLLLGRATHRERSAICLSLTRNLAVSLATPGMCGRPIQPRPSHSPLARETVISGHPECLN